MTCERCQQPTRKLICWQGDVICATCHEASRTKGQRATAVIGDDIPGGFVQEHFGHQPEVFYSKSEMARRAKELGLVPMVRHVPGDEHVTRWV